MKMQKKKNPPGVRSGMLVVGLGGGWSWGRGLVSSKVWGRG